LQETTIEYDGLTAQVSEGGYKLETPERQTVVEQLEADALEEFAPWVQNWWYWEHACAVQTPAGRRYLRMLERAETMSVPERMSDLRGGIETAWGELTVIASTDEEGRRRYTVRHTDDGPEAELEPLETPEEARALATYDADGRYRPLKSAPSLRRGWSFTHISATRLIAVIGYLYPASIPNWDREQAGALDITHWR
ncbi:MAG: DR2241 family protein, partial [Haloferacaceae archaeon]|nr:DR2241 family protein [Haloferacaceae archaeon]